MMSDNKAVSIANLSRIKRLRKKWMLLTAVLTALLTILQTIALLTGYDAERSAFSPNNPLGTITTILMVVSVLALASFAFVLNRSKDDIELPKDAAITVRPCSTKASFFSAFGGMFILASSVIGYFGRSYDADIFPLILFLLSIPAAAYLIYTAISPAASSPVMTVLGIFPAAYMTVSLVQIFAEDGVVIGDPVRIFCQMTYAALALYFLLELRSRVGKANIGGYYALGMIATLMSFTYSFSYLIAHIASLAASEGSKISKLSSIHGSVMAATGILFIAFYIIFRMPCMLAIKKSAIEETDTDEMEEGTEDQSSPDNTADEEQ